MQKNKIGLKIKNIKKIQEKNGRRKKKGEKRNTPQNCKSPEWYLTIENVTEYAHIHIHP